MIVTFTTINDVAFYLEDIDPELEVLDIDTVRDVFHASGINYGDRFDTSDDHDRTVLDTLYADACEAALTAGI